MRINSIGTAKDVKDAKDGKDAKDDKDDKDAKKIGNSCVFAVMVLFVF